jgi:nitroreductase
MSGTLNEVFQRSYLDHSGALPPIDADEFFKVITTRRSIRRFSGKPIPSDAMEKILKAGLLAPNSSNLQTWEFYWVQSPLKRKEINYAFLGQPAATTAAEIVVCVARTGVWRQHAKEMAEILRQAQPPAPKAAVKYYTSIVPLAYNLGPLGILGPLKKLVLTVTGWFRPVPRECTSKADLQVWAAKSASLACENIMLAARALGFDSCPMEGMDSHRIKKILHLPSDAVVVMGISLGERLPEGVYGPQIRFPWDRAIKKV